ncbi:MAG: hypothetical protein KC418_07180 [Anaerolineales bacterium]|nr:hypothetical protein [Anaerolineales bacterium]MCB8954383.1 hypothetical protein [Ardenticatenales bacterium]MCB9418176.1 hypothetical protein [Ardenticatenaceae bacterium]
MLEERFAAIELGPIVRLQIQTQPLRVGDGDDRWYDIRWLAALPALRLTTEGIIGLADGQEQLDVHHVAHPRSRSGRPRGKENSISFNVTAHYTQITRQYGDHMWPGSGGENILIETNTPVSPADFQRGLLIQTAGGLIHLTHVNAAVPCVPFARFALHKPHRPAVELVKNALVFLGDGMRGFYAAYDGAPVEVRVGDWAYLL